MKKQLKHALQPGLLGLVVMGFASGSFADQGRPAEQILQESCTACHAQQENNTFSRISNQRKTPEGWLMTIARMQITHGLEISNQDRWNVVKYLSDKQGLAPSESSDVRYALERRLNTVESYQGEELGEMCARCHSGARFALQRRPAEEWEHLVHFHLGQWQSLEYQALSRDRDWLDLALGKTVFELAERYPLKTKDWDKWSKNMPSAGSFKGSWSFAGHYTGKGEVRGVMQVEPTEGDRFSVRVTGEYADGTPFSGEGTAVLYSGHEWRANITVDDVVMRQVFSAADGVMQGRMFERKNDERGLDFTAVQEGKSRVLAVQPAYVKSGTEATITVVGTGLSGKPQFGKGIEVVAIESATDNMMKARIRVGDDAQPGLQSVKVGRAKGGELAVYEAIDTIKVVPELVVARVGGNGGSVDKVEGRFDAEAWAVDAKGNPYRLGVVPAQWSVDAWDETAVATEDLRFAGKMDAQTGVFVPGDAGPNPERKLSASNVGNLKVIAKVIDGTTTHEAESHMYVAVQRWNIQPIP